MNLGDLIFKFTNYLLSQTPPFNNIQTKRTLHNGVIRYERKGQEEFSSLFPIQTFIELKLDDIINFNLEAFCSDIYLMCDKNIEQFHKGFFNEMDKVITFTGNKFDARGKAFSYDLLLDSLENIEIGFDSDGNPRMPQFIMHPIMVEKMKKLKETPEQKQRLENIIAKKKEAYYAKKCYRKLSKISY